MIPRHHRFLSLRTSLGVALVGTLAAGCVQRVYEQPAPAPPPAALSITAQRRQSQAQQDRDKADCQRMANGQATSSATWAQIFTACMGGRGYMVE
jgi:hypothetical protein